MKSQAKRDAINTAIVIVGGIAIATFGVGAIIAAPFEIVTTAVLVGAAKYALDKNNKDEKCPEECCNDDG
jgi:hypothetical protein